MSKDTVWVELRLGLKMNKQSVDENELAEFVKGLQKEAKGAKKWLGKQIKLHCTLLWCGKGRAPLEVRNALNDIIQEKGMPELHCKFGELKQFGWRQEYIVVDLDPEEQQLKLLQDIQVALYEKIGGMKGMVDPKERPFHPHITLWDFSEEDPKNDAGKTKCANAFTAIRNKEPHDGCLTHFVGRSLVFAPVLYVVKRDANTKETRTVYALDEDIV